MYGGRFGILARIRRLRARIGAKDRERGAEDEPAPIEAPPWDDLAGAYMRHVRRLTAALPRDEAMAAAVGGGFDEFGRLELAILRHHGLAANHYLIDVGCGSGRLAKPLAEFPDGRYLGVDVVPELLDYAREICGRPDWRFVAVDHIAIPEADAQADMVCFFSVFTHLLHEQSYWYLEEARRVLRPGGQIVFSMLEFAEPGHWAIFESTLAGSKRRSGAPLNVFLERSVVSIWAKRLGLELEALHGAAEQIAGGRNLGQAVCVLRKPLTAA